MLSDFKIKLSLRNIIIIIIIIIVLAAGEYN